MSAKATCSAACGAEFVDRKMIVGVSVSTVEEALAAEADGADYPGVSPVFNTPTKTDTPEATGLQGLQKIRQTVNTPHCGNRRNSFCQCGTGGGAAERMESLSFQRSWLHQNPRGCPEPAGRHRFGTVCSGIPFTK
jgi:hypothetical protein